MLGEEDKRILYDAGGMELVKQGVGDEGGGGGMDPFAALFGGGRQQNRNRGQEAHVELGVSLEDMYNGNEVEARIQRRVVCRGCSPGKKHKPKCDTCGRCPDEVKMVQRQMGPGMIVQQEERVQSKEKCKVSGWEVYCYEVYCYDFALHPTTSYDSQRRLLVPRPLKHTLRDTHSRWLPPSPAFYNHSKFTPQPPTTTLRPRTPLSRLRSRGAWRTGRRSSSLV